MSTADNLAAGLGPPPYEMRLSERPQDRAEFDDWVEFLIAHCRPGWMYRPWPWSSAARRRELRQAWERTVRIHMGRVYELGRASRG